MAARFHAFRSSILHGDAVGSRRARPPQPRLRQPSTPRWPSSPPRSRPGWRRPCCCAAQTSAGASTADGRDHRRWPFSSKRSAWPRELAAVREGAARAFDALVAEAERRAVDHFPRMEVNVRQPQQGPAENSRTAASGALGRFWTALGDGLFGADPRCRPPDAGQSSMTRSSGPSGSPDSSTTTTTS
jgi:hypothetical protein